MAAASMGFRRVVEEKYLGKPWIRRASIFLCTNPIYYCTFFASLDRPLLGYFGLPLLYMVPHADWEQWTQDFASLASNPRTVFVANNPLLVEQLAWQSGVR